MAEIATRIYTTIKTMILDMELRPGELILVQSLAERLASSRTPVKEAMIKLSQEGLVEPATGRKWRVTPLRLDDLLETYEIREWLEAQCASVAAGRIGAEELEAIIDSMRSQREAMAKQDYHRFFEQDSRFHSLIVAAAGKRVAGLVLEGLAARIQRIRYLNLYVPGRLERTLEEHEAILGALRDNDPAGAAEAVHEHLGAVRRHLADLHRGDRPGLPRLVWFEGGRGAAVTGSPDLASDSEISHSSNSRSP